MEQGRKDEGGSEGMAGALHRHKRRSVMPSSVRVLFASSIDSKAAEHMAKVGSDKMVGRGSQVHERWYESMIANLCSSWLGAFCCQKGGLVKQASLPDSFQV